MNHLEPISRCSNYKHTVFVYYSAVRHASLQQLMRSSHPYTKVLAILCEVHRCHLLPCQGRQRVRDNGGLSQYHCASCVPTSPVLFWGHMLQDQITSPPWGFCCLPRLGQPRKSYTTEWIILLRDSGWNDLFSRGFVPSIPTSWTNEGTLSTKNPSLYKRLT